MIPYNDATDINAWVKDALKTLKYPYIRFAADYGIHRNTVSNWCKPGRPVPKWALEVITKEMHPEDGRFKADCPKA